MAVIVYINTMQREIKSALSQYLSEGGLLPGEVVYEVGGPKKQGFLSGLLETVNLPDVTIKPHKNMIYLIGGVALTLSLGAIATAYIIKNK